jgi:hypothetical protein
MGFMSVGTGEGNVRSKICSLLDLGRSNSIPNKLPLLPRNHWKKLKAIMVIIILIYNYNHQHDGESVMIN